MSRVVCLVGARSFPHPLRQITFRGLFTLATPPQVVRAQSALPLVILRPPLPVVRL